MDLIPHWGDCKNEVEKLKLLLSESQDQNVAYARDLQDLTCRLRMALLKNNDRCTCLKDVQETVVEISGNVVD